MSSAPRRTRRAPALSPLRLARMVGRFTLAQLSTKAQIQICRLSRLERGLAKPRPDEIERLERILGVLPSDDVRDLLVTWRLVEHRHSSTIANPSSIVATEAHA